MRQHRDELRDAAGLVAIHPNWWGKPPAILSGWLDRILVPGVAYRLDDAGGAPESLLTLRQLLVVNTSDTTEERERTLFGDPLDAIWRRCLAPYLGEPEVTPAGAPGRRGRRRGPPRLVARRRRSRGDAPVRRSLTASGHFR